MDYSHVLGCVFGELTVTAHTGVKDRMVCACSCGNIKEARLSHLRGGTVKSCGCLLVRRPREVFGKHLQSQTDTYKVWDAMVRRCTQPHAQAFHNYGGRGIQVCERWLGAEGLAHFLADMGEKPPGLSLDRRDNDGHYEPGNCRWTDRHTQSRNRRTNTNLTFHGQTLTVAEWAMTLGIRDTTIHERLKRGWDVERTLTSPVKALRSASD